MSKLERAMQAANDRKLAAVGAGEGIIFSDSELQDRAVFSGYDIEYDELVKTSSTIAEFYSQNAHNVGLRPLFISAWCDGLLTGLLLASLPPTSGPDGTDDIGLGGDG
jgi:hypothetical protein